MKLDGEATRRADRELAGTVRHVTPEFTAFPKIPRLNRPVIVTEKIDGTNAAVGIHDARLVEQLVPRADAFGKFVGDHFVFAQSRKRIITPHRDNFGFARFVWDQAEQLGSMLGHGLHFGEWYGRGIQRGYGLEDRWFALFNVDRWREREHELIPLNVCTVPILDEQPDLPTACDALPYVLHDLREHGSFAMDVRTHVSLNGPQAPPGRRHGEDGPPAEGVVLHHKQGGISFKVTLENDEVPKAVAAQAATAK